MKAFRFDIVTLFPEIFASACGTSILKRAIESGRVEVILHDIRQYAKDKHRTVDDIPYGGGAGMLMKPEPVVSAVRAVPVTGEKKLVIYMSPQGQTLDQKMVKRFSELDQLIILCGHYEGMDQRAIDSVVEEEVSVGDYVLTGGEVPALIVCDSVARLKDGVLGNSVSHTDESFENGLLEYPQYTRPAEFEGKRVPEVLTGGHHQKIKEWRDRESLLKTRSVRPDLVSSNKGVVK